MFICQCLHELSYIFFFFNDTATTEIYTLSLHDALPISGSLVVRGPGDRERADKALDVAMRQAGATKASMLQDLERGLKDRKSTRLNSSHANISYAVFCLKKKKNIDKTYISDNQMYLIRQ